MKDKEIVKSAVLYYMNETAKNLCLVDFLLEKVDMFKTYTNLLENHSDVELFKEIFGFGKKKPMSLLTKSEDMVIQNLKNKIDAGMKELPKLSKVTVADPTSLGMSLEQMVNVVKDVKEASDAFTRMYGETDQDAQEEMQEKAYELMKAKAQLIGLVAFKLTELRKEAQDALAKLAGIVPASQLKSAIDMAKKNYVPSLPMRSVLDQLTGRDLPDVSSQPMGMPGAMRLREEAEEEATEMPWNEAEPEGK